VKRLAEFSRVNISAGQSRKVSFNLPATTFHIIGPDYKWQPQPGKWDIMVGASSADIRSTATVDR